MSHFEGKQALQHVIERRAKGIIATSESHGTEMPGHMSAAADAAKEMAVALLLLCLLGVPLLPTFLFAIAYLVWKIGRSAHLGWSRLERLHRIIQEEQWEIEHHRPQEREELAALYRAKGFEGELLEQVLDVLMAEGDRLLQVMLEEELGLSLQVYEHPLKQALGAGIGALLSVTLSIFGGWIWFPYGLWIGALLALGIASGMAARWEGNRPMPSVIWNISLALLSGACAFFIREFVLRLL